MSNRGANYDAVRRILWMLRILELSPKRCMTVASLAGQLGVTRETVDRYVKALSDIYYPRLGGPILTIEGKGFARAARLTRGLLDHEERSIFRFAAVRAAFRVPTCGEGSFLGDCSESALEVLRGTLAPRIPTFIDCMEKAFCNILFGPKDLRVTKEVIDQLQSAIVYRRLVEVARRSRWGKVVTERLDPPAQVELAFTASAAAVLASHKWPVKSSWRDADDGRQVLEFELPVIPELVSWIVSLGPQVEVLEPPELRSTVIAEFRMSLQLYAARPSN